MLHVLCGKQQLCVTGMYNGIVGILEPIYYHDEVLNLSFIVL